MWKILYLDPLSNPVKNPEVGPPPTQWARSSTSVAPAKTWWARESHSPGETPATCRPSKGRYGKSPGIREYGNIFGKSPGSLVLVIDSLTLALEKL